MVDQQIEGLLDTYVGENKSKDKRNPKKKISGYWQNADNIIEELKIFMKKEGFERVPSYVALRKLGRTDLAKGIQNNHGIDKIRTLFGEETSERKDRDYWRSETNFLHELKKFMKENSLVELPNSRQIMELGRGDINHAAQRYHGGLDKSRAMLGEQPNKRPKGYWNKENTLNESRKLFNELGYLPTQKELCEKGMSSLASAIVRNISFSSLRREFGQETRREAGIWKDEDYAFQQAKKIIEETSLNELPGSWTLKKLGYKSFVSAIHTHHSGFTIFRKRFHKFMNIKTSPEKSWKELGYTLEQAIEIMDEEGWQELPSFKRLHKFGYSSLGGAIVKYHGGLPVFRKRLSKYMGQIPENHLESLLDNYTGGNEQ